ncbi:GNAT family N-acetyltransferase [Maribacter arcticus]|jgi:ribosomal protein S18 acetylase RimI-like enzyme|uniref:Acetyltransferase (GNAT) family protein n=1 Tax=Maribacter arcticus TaxID=561365 RepID=A0A1T4ZYL5_9FLAO|nr:GNAT family N-acetyltransferase [Maribacter arcticus]SKB27818.1 Acetyltransferase (GNAT) family protein [Maribacter arcticus]|tara:strand:- start:11 stop:529 length:519 start_codon:yes stop_codon:yes gene_type:complete
MVVKNVRKEDIDEIFRLYNIASNYQKSKKTVVVWPDFDREMVSQEIAEHRQFKLLIDDEIACIWAITFSDAQIWEKRNEDPAIYIHRIATNPKFRGHNFVGAIVDWAKDYANVHTKQFIRLDTIGENTRLINHYCNCGFDFLGMFDLPNVDELPPHYKEGPVCLFEIDLAKK